MVRRWNFFLKWSLFFWVDALIFGVHPGNLTYIDTFVKRYLLSILPISGLHVKFQGRKETIEKKPNFFFPCHQELFSTTNPLFTVTYTLPRQKCPPYIHPENDRPQQTRERVPRDLPVLVTKSPRFDPSSSKMQGIFRRLCIKCLEGLTTTVRDYHSHEGHLLRLMNN